MEYIRTIPLQVIMHGRASVAPEHAWRCGCDDEGSTPTERLRECEGGWGGAVLHDQLLLQQMLLRMMLLLLLVALLLITSSEQQRTVFLPVLPVCAQYSWQKYKTWSTEGRLDFSITVGRRR
eukprot:TRINITY_DN571_c0_g1_i1.p2 TRINITY_DN571_c0_g1~~TRINITY_DN571_c0_g1_i1.p2  ORF type:complete len:122 (-),score=22.58 TRINITY_DN571_c0_g1_i1:631-996(-)